MKQNTVRGLAVALVTCALAVVLAMSCGGDGGQGSAEKTVGSGPIIIIAVEGLRADSLGCYGAPAATPAFDALAAESLRFEWAFAQAPQAQPSLAALLSALYPTSNGLRAPGDELADEATTLAEALAAAGWQTAAFVEGDAAASDRGLAQGFAIYQVRPSPGAAAADWMAAHAEEHFLLLVAGWSNLALEQVSGLLAGSGRPEGFEQRVQEVLASRGTANPIAFEGPDLEWARTWYAARVQVIDALLDGFMTAFRAAGLDRRATLVVLGSTGFALQEHGDLLGESLYTPVSRVPLLVRYPGGSAVQTVSKVVEVVDLMPTLLELAGQSLPAGLQGASLLPVISGGGQPPYVAFAESPQAGGQRLVALGGMALVSGPGGAGAELYDLAADPLQQHDLAAAQADKLAVMVRHLEAWEKLVAIASLDPNLRAAEDLDEETLKQLKSLGYIQ
ncbi:MAG: sulfatase-like hydrolase/transferase [Thermoanaerobaculales bacterium]|jgi:arylsulfatase A-like enzyme|nr:sulfatase-like hydrolase/transferase [Thermoanaerobaculales bacterium]